MDVSIRPFEERDRDRCREILASIPDWFGIESSNKAYIGVLGKFPTAVAVVEGKVIGFAALEEHNRESVELHVIAVERQYHNEGAGTALVNWCEAWCRHAGAPWFHVKTRGPATPDPQYEKTRKFYEAKGFTPLFESLTEWGPENAALVMVKKLEGH